MPLTTASGNITSTTGNVTQILIAEQDNYSTPVAISPAANTPTATTANGFYRFQPRINSADIAREGTTIPSVFFDGSSAQSKDAPGPFDITNGMSFGLSGNGTGLFLRMLTQDKNPTWNIYGGTGTSFPAQVTIVSAGSLTSTSPLTIADNLSSTTNPVQIHATLTSATLDSGGRGVVVIKGTDNDDDPIEETIAFVSATASGATRLWFKTVTEVTVSGFTAGTVGLVADDRSARVVFVPQDDELVAFWTVEAAKGNVPNVYDGVVMQNASVEITRDALVSFDCTFLGRQARLYQNLSGATLAYNETAGSTNRATKTNIMRTGSNHIASASADVYGGWQSILTAENSDIQVAMQDTTLTINQELEYTNVLGEQFQVTQPARGEKRLVQLESTVVYSRENNYSTYFQGNLVIPNVKVTWRQRGLGAYPYELVLDIPEAQLTVDPDPAVTETGTITQNVTLKAIKPTNIDYEYRFIARYSDYTALPAR